MATKGKFWLLLERFFREYPIQRRLSDHTIESWRKTWNQLLWWAANEKGVKAPSLSFSTFTIEFVTEFLDCSSAKRGWAPQTRNQSLSNIRAFFQFASSTDPDALGAAGRLSQIPKAKCVDSTGVIDYIPKEAMKSLLSAPDDSTRTGLRDKVYMSLAYDLGARTAEMTGLRIGDISLDRKVVLLNGKGGKQRAVPLSTNAFCLLKKYMGMFHPFPTADDYLFYVKRQGKKERISSDTVAHLLNVNAEKARKICPSMPDKVHPHQAFRASRAMHLLQNGAPLTTIAMLLGHSDPATTARYYAAADVEMKREITEKASEQTLPALSKEKPRWKEEKDLIGKLFFNGE